MVIALGRHDQEDLVAAALGLPPERGRSSLAGLTARQLEVLALLAAGMSNGQIAQTLFVSEHTVKSHVHSILHKLGVASRTQAAVRAVRWGAVRGA